jgi:hypothetical protein
MRTQTNLDRSVGGNLITLPGVPAALPQSSAIGGGKTAKMGKRRIGVASRKMSPGATTVQITIPADLLAASRKTFDSAMSGQHPVDPMLGRPLSCLTSAVNSVVKRSGSLIEKSLRAALAQAGYTVFTQVAMQLSKAATDLVRTNSRDMLRGVNVKLEAPADDAPLVTFDMLVIDPRTRRATLIECKRGNGATELRKIQPITATLLAGSLQVASYLKAKGIAVRSVEACVIDYYGRSGFPDAIRVTGEQLDAYFNAPVKPLVDAVLEGVRARLFAFIPDLLNVALSDARGDGVEAGPADLAELPTGARIQPHHLPMIEIARGGRRRNLRNSAVTHT